MESLCNCKLYVKVALFPNVVHLYYYLAHIHNRLRTTVELNRNNNSMYN